MRWPAMRTAKGRSLALCENEGQVHSMAIAKVSDTYEVEIPQEIREAMKLKPGDELVFVVRGSIASFMLRPADPVAELAGSMKGTYPEGYLEEERRNWR